ncbi:hypothetical protein KSP39_PZI008411 [Platanthera zijinensis]|uniref:Uncharacterized protein n=1 Tax=Platanthera zijinensis TaxID=2320716 RepID=A0AAP0BN43_9ASPA
MLRSVWAMGATDRLKAIALPSLSVGTCSVTADFYIFGLGGLDAILGFLHKGQPCRLDGDSSLLRSPSSLCTIQRTTDVGLPAGLWAFSGRSAVPLPFSTDHQELSTALADAIQPPMGSPPAQFSLVRKKDGSWRHTTQPSYLVAVTTFRGTLARKRFMLLGLTIDEDEPDVSGAAQTDEDDLSGVSACPELVYLNSFDQDSLHLGPQMEFSFRFQARWVPEFFDDLSALLLSYYSNNIKLFSNFVFDAQMTPSDVFL